METTIWTRPAVAENAAEAQASHWLAGSGWIVEKDEKGQDFPIDEGCYVEPRSDDLPLGPSLLSPITK